MKNCRMFLGLVLALFLFACENTKEVTEEVVDDMKSTLEKTSYVEITADGELIRPTDYRTWVFVGTPLTPDDLNNGKAPFPEFHNVYIDPQSYEVYKETGKFREGTVLIKELVTVGSKQAVSGAGYFEGEFIGLEASVKSAEHFPDEPGNWAIFSFSDNEGVLKDKAKPYPAAVCNACHQANAEDDYVFTQYYPVLRAAKNFGKGNPENEAQRLKIPLGVEFGR